jgi:hypothetical protein
MVVGGEEGRTAAVKKEERRRRWPRKLGFFLLSKGEHEWRRALFNWNAAVGGRKCSSEKAQMAFFAK